MKLQKVYKVDFLSKKKKVSEGKVPQYYVENNHQAIISPTTFDEVHHGEAGKAGEDREVHFQPGKPGWRLRLESTYPPKPEGKTAAGDSVWQTGICSIFYK